MRQWETKEIKTENSKPVDILEVYKTEIFDTRIAVSKLINDSRFVVSKKIYSNKIVKETAKA